MKMPREVARTILRRVRKKGRPVPRDNPAPYLNWHYEHDYIMPDGKRVSAAEVRRLDIIAHTHWNGGRPGLPWPELLTAAAGRVPPGLSGRLLRHACTEALIAEIEARGLKMPGERRLRAKALDTVNSIIAEIAGDKAAE
jgi:hypothetical protein